MLQKLDKYYILLDNHILLMNRHEASLIAYIHLFGNIFHITLMVVFYHIFDF